MSCNKKETFINNLKKGGQVNDALKVSKGIEDLIIRDVEKFSQDARQKYGFTENNRNLVEFEVREDGTYISYINDDFFTHIDNEINSQIEDNIEAYVTEDTNTINEPLSIEPSYEKYLRVKEDLKNRLEKQLDLVKQDIRSNLKNKSKLLELLEQKRLIEERLEGTPDGSKVGIYQEIESLKSDDGTYHLQFHINKDFERLSILEEVIKSTNDPQEKQSALQEAKTITRFYQKAGTFSVGEVNPLFYELFEQPDGEKIEVNTAVNDKGEIVLNPNAVKTLRDFRVKAEEYENRVIEVEQKKVLTTLANEHSMLKSMYPNKDFTFEELTDQFAGRKDTNWSIMLAGDVTMGNGHIPQIAFSYFNDTYNKALSDADRIRKRIEELQPELNSVLKDESIVGKDYSIGIPGIKGMSFDLFREKDENGLVRDAIVRRFTSKYNEEKYYQDREFKDRIKAAKTKDNAKAEIAKIQKEKDNWYKENAPVLDLRQIPEIIEDERFTSYKEVFKKENSEQYKKNIIAILGEKGYNEQVQIQKEKLVEYETLRAIQEEDILTKNNVDSLDKLSDKDINKIKFWIHANSPFSRLTSFYDGKDNKVGNSTVYSNMAYSITVPRRKKVNKVFENNVVVYKETKEDTGFYSKDFETIENNDVLLEFHGLIEDITDKFYSSLPSEMKENFNPFGIMSVKKQGAELLLTDAEDLTQLQRISLALRKLLDWIYSIFTDNIISDLSYAERDPVTGEPLYKINTEFKEFNKSKISKLYNNQIILVKNSLGIKATKGLKLNETFDVTTNQTVINLLAENLGVDNSLSALQKRLPKVDFTKLQVGKVLKQSLTDRVVLENSFDLPKILKTYTTLTHLFEARQEAMPTMLLVKDYYSKIEKPKLNKQGRPIRDGQGNPIKEGYRTNAIKQFNAQFERVVLNNYNSKNELEYLPFVKNTGIGRLFKKTFQGKKFTDKEEREIIEEEYGFKKSIKNPEEKVLNKKLKEAYEVLDEQRKTTSDPEEVAQLSKMMGNIVNHQNSLGKEVTLTAMTDSLFRLIRFTGLGYNIKSNVVNLMEGQIANLNAGASGLYFPMEYLYEANHIVSGNILKNNSFGIIKRYSAIKAAKLVRDYDILEDTTNELQKASVKTNFSKLRSLQPYELTKRVEFVNQAPVMIAMLKDTIIKDSNGNESSVWKVMDKEGKLTGDFRTKENIDNWERRVGQEYLNFKNRISQAIKNIHGDYSSLSGNMGSEFITGKAVLMFKRWLPRQIWVRFAKEHDDVMLGVKGMKGRYRSHNLTTISVLGAIIGTIAFGPFGFLGGAGVFAGIYKMVGVEPEGASKRRGTTERIREITFTLGAISKNFMGLPLNLIAGKELIKGPDFSEKGFNKIDNANIKSNITELTLLLYMLAAQVLARGLLDKEDEEEEKYRNLLVNTTMQLTAQTTSYLNGDLYNSVGSIAFISKMQQINQLAKEIGEYTSEKRVTTHRMKDKFGQVFLPSPIRHFDSSLGFKKSMDKQYTTNYLDYLFMSAEDKSKFRIRDIRTEYRNTLREEDLTEKQVKEMVNEKYPTKTKFVSIRKKSKDPIPDGKVYQEMEKLYLKSMELD